MKPEEVCIQCAELYFDKSMSDWALIPKGPCESCVFEHNDYLEGETECDKCRYKNTDCICYTFESEWDYI